MKRFISIIMAVTIVFSSMSATAIEVNAKTTTETTTSDTTTKRTGKKLTYEQIYERIKDLSCFTGGTPDDGNSETQQTTNNTQQTTQSTGKLAAPTGLTVTTSSNKIVLKWNSVDGAEAYRVSMYNSKSGKYEKYKTVESEQCTITGITKNKEYKFVVTALDVVDGKYKAGTNSEPVVATTNNKPSTSQTNKKPSTTTQTTQQQTSGTVKFTDYYGKELKSSAFVYRSYLSKDQQYLYDKIKTAAINGDTTVKFNRAYDVFDLNVAVSAVNRDNPSIIWLKNTFCGTKSGNGYISVRLSYFSDLVKDKAGSLQTMDDYLKPMLDKAVKLSSDVEKVKYVHDWLIYNCNDASANANDMTYHAAYAAIVNKKGVCEGYSEAFIYCMQKLGIQATGLHGTTWSGEQHVWNMVKVGGDWYELDIYWDDMITRAEKDYDYTYFMQTTASLKNLDSYNGVSRTRSSDSGSTLLPTAKGTKYSPSKYSYSKGSNFKNLAKVVLTKNRAGSSGNAANVGTIGHAKTTKTLPTGWYKYSDVLTKLGVKSLKESDWTKDGDFYYIEKTRNGKGTGNYMIYDTVYDNYYYTTSSFRIIYQYNFKTDKWDTLNNVT